MTHLPAVDGLRAVSILLVIASHYLTDLIPGGLGVTIFFFISGYLICSLLHAEIRDTGRLRFRYFYARRVLRLCPALYVAILVSVVTFYLSLDVFSPFSISAAILYLYNYAELYAGEVAYPIPLWSLAIEEHFYLLFPATLLLLIRFAGLRSTIVVYAGAALLVLLWRIILTSALHANWYRIYIGTDTRIDCIFFGVILALALQDEHLRTKITAAADTRMLVSGLLVLVLALVVRNEFYRQTFRYTLEGFGLFLIIAPVLTGAIPGVFKAVIELASCQYIAKLSYSLYLYHLVVLDWLTRLNVMGEVGTLLAAGFISVALSMLSYHVVELPMLRLRRLFGSHATY